MRAEDVVLGGSYVGTNGDVRTVERVLAGCVEYTHGHSAGTTYRLRGGKGRCSLATFARWARRGATEADMRPGPAERTLRSITEKWMSDIWDRPGDAAARLERQLRDLIDDLTARQLAYAQVLLSNGNHQWYYAIETAIAVARASVNLSASAPEVRP